MTILGSYSLLKLYYDLKSLIPRTLQILVRRGLVTWKRKSYSDIWPIDYGSGMQPEQWQGWPNDKQFALVLTHDVDTAKGQERCTQLLQLERENGFVSSFNFVPRKYKVSSQLIRKIIEDGFEVGVHGLYHDGKYYESRETFRTRAVEINKYLKDWGAVGFRSPSMLHNLEWIHDLNIEYDASTFDTDPFEPQPDGAGTIFPFYVEDAQDRKGYIELPYTLPQDFTVYVLMKEKTIDIWKKKLDWIHEKGGMALLNTHPDYINFDGTRCAYEEYPVRLYAEFLEYVKIKYKGQFWHVLPREISSYWKTL